MALLRRNDPIPVLVGAMVAKIGWDLVWQSVHELVDTALDPERVELIRREILGAVARMEPPRGGGEDEQANGIEREAW
ncbi:MAG: hypothetical protein R6W66_04235 [Pelovirga sp.]